MNLSRSFQLGAMIICVGALAGIYLNSRYCRELTDDADKAAAAIAAVTPHTPVTVGPPVNTSPPGSPTATATTLPADQPPLPKSTAEILDALEAKGFALELVVVVNEPTERTAFRVAGAPVGIGLYERNGKLLSVEAMTLASKALTDDMRIGFAATVGEVATGLPRDGVSQVVGLLLDDVSSSQRGLYRTIDDGKHRIKVDVTRHDDGGYSIVFSVALAEKRVGGER